MASSVKDLFRDNKSKQVFGTKRGAIFQSDSREILKNLKTKSTDLIVTSPPYCLQSKKEYGNEDERGYLEWFRSFATDFKRVLKPTGSLVIDIGGGWRQGKPTRSLTHFKLMIMLCEEFGFKLAQEIFWYNPSKLPSPAEWVTVKRVRLKDAVNCVWWLSASDNPKANNGKVLLPYSESMEELVTQKKNPTQYRPSGHEITHKIGKNLGASIPPNLLTIPNTSSNDWYQRACRENKLKPHPARFPRELPEFFIRFLTNAGDTVIDPFGGSCIVGEIAESLGRKWICVESRSDYIEGGKLRFQNPSLKKGRIATQFYQMPNIGTLWTYPDKDFLESSPSKQKSRRDKEATP